MASEKRNAGRKKYVENYVTPAICMRLYPSNVRHGAVAYGTITILKAFVIKINVMQSKDGGFFISYPSYQNKSGDYVDTVYCFDMKIREKLQDYLIDLLSDLDDITE